MPYRTLCFGFSLLFFASGFASENTTDLSRAIRENNLEFLTQTVTASNVNARDSRGATLLMQAAAYGSIDAMKILIRAGADLNAVNDFKATALLWCARDAHKARLLIEHGADVKAQSKQGRTPLMMASLRDGGSDIVALMLAKGADVKATDSRGDTALSLASETGDTRVMRLLLEKGADIESRNKKGETPLAQAAQSMRPEAVRLLLAKHPDVNVATTWYPSVRNGQIALLKLTALHHAAFNGPFEVVRDLVRAGANVNAQDVRGIAALTFVIASDHADPQIVKTLIAAGADVNARSNTGETPLDWAEKFGNPEIIAALEKADAKHGIVYSAPEKPTTARVDRTAAVARSLRLLQSSSAEFFNQSGCVGCHHQPLIAQAQRAANMAGIGLNESLTREQLLQLKSQWASSQEEFLQSLNPGGGPNRLGESLLGLYAAGYAPDRITDSAVVDLAESQLENGLFPSGEAGARPPITESLIGSTARAIRALQIYSIPARQAEFEARIGRAKKWLERAVASSSDDYAMRLLGLYWAAAGDAVIKKSGRILIEQQREDGGWSANPHLISDAYSTGKALYALVESGAVRVIDRVYQRGADYLLSTQYPDGSWYVRSRSMKFQPYFESGFPFGDDQWISAAGTSWAVMALGLGGGTPAPVASR